MRAQPRLTRAMTSDEIRERFLSFFESRDHKRLPSGSLVPAEHDPSVLLTTAGMHPLKPYFQGREKPPHHRLTSCQKCFRTPDIDQVGLTTRHLTFFEMLGNFSIGDYFKAGRGRVRVGALAARASASTRTTSGSRSSRATRSSASARTRRRSTRGWRSASRASGSSAARARRTSGRPGRLGPCGPCSELYLDRGLDFGKADDLPGGDNERFLEYWNLVFMQFEQNPVNTLTPLPAQNIDTGLGLNRLAAILQGVTSIFDTDQFVPLIGLGEQLSGKRAGSAAEVDRALRVLADHTRGMSFLIADGVVPVQRGPRLRAAPPDAARDRAGPPDRHRARLPAAVRARSCATTMGAAYPELTRAGRHRRHVAAHGGGDLQPHARAGPEDARGRDRAGARPPAPRASAPTRRSGCTTRSASRSTSRSSSPPSAAWAWTSRASSR